MPGTSHSDFTGEELTWIAAIKQRRDNVVPDEVQARLIRKGVIDSTNMGLKITGLGEIILEEAQINKRQFAVVERIIPR